MVGNNKALDMRCLIERAQAGDNDAQSKIVEENLGLVHSVVKRYYNRGTEADDLFQLGAIGLIKAIKKFDFSFNVQFSTYAVSMIMGEIKRFLRDDGMVKVSRGLKEIAQRAWTVKEILQKELQREPTINEIANKLCIETPELVMALDSANAPESLNAVISTGDSIDIHLMDMVADESEQDLEVVNKVALFEIINSFEKKDKQIILLRYFKQKTQSEIAKMLGLSQVQVSRIEKRVLEQIREKISS